MTATILWGNDLFPFDGIDANVQFVGPWNANYTTAESHTFSGGTANSNSNPEFLPGGYTLKGNSLAIDSAPNPHPLTDLDGNPRQYRSGPTNPPRPADRGCYEYSDTDGDGLPDAWEIMYLGAAAASDSANRDQDPDGDGYTNYEEWLAITHPNSRWSRPPGLVLYVDPRSGYGSDAPNVTGSFDSPVQSIGRAIQLVPFGGSTAVRICLRDGFYSGSLNRNLTTGSGSSGKRFYIKGINGKSRVTIDCGGEGFGRFLKIENYSFDGACGIEGVTIRNGYATDNGGAVLVTAAGSSSQPFIARCTIAGCTSAGNGGRFTWRQARSCSMRANFSPTKP